MSRDFYNTQEYKEKQSVIMKKNWKRGVFNFLFKREKRKCARKECRKMFEIKQSDPKIYCSKSCFVKVNNVKRGPHPEDVKLKIAKALTGRKNPHWGIKIPRVEVICANPKCKKIFLKERWAKRKFCSIKWLYQPKTFDLKTQNYTPDFYLPEQKIYIEVKNFLWKYSKIRDEKFRKLYPDINLFLLLKKDYLKLEKKYSHLIKNWEYKNSPFNI